MLSVLKYVRTSYITMKKFTKKAIIGMILGDAYVEKKSALTALIKIDHSISQLSLVNHKRNLLKEYHPSDIKIRTYYDGRPLEKKSVSFKTKSSVKLYFYRKEFYKLEKTKYKKVLPKWIKKYLIDPITLAYWYMDDGSKQSSKRNPNVKSVILHTQAFTKKEVVLIIKEFNSQLNLNARIHKESKNRGLKIYIPNENYEFSYLVKPYIIKEMLYKLPL